MTTMNWKILETKSGKISYALCIGEKLHREFIDVALCYAFEMNSGETFSNSINDFLADSKLYFEAKTRGEYYKRKFERTNSSDFRALQKKLEKAELKAKVKI